MESQEHRYCSVSLLIRVTGSNFLAVALGALQDKKLMVNLGTFSHSSISPSEMNCLLWLKKIAGSQKAEHLLRMQKDSRSIPVVSSLKVCRWQEM